MRGWLTMLACLASAVACSGETKSDSTGGGGSAGIGASSGTGANAGTAGTSTGGSGGSAGGGGVAGSGNASGAGGVSGSGNTSGAGGAFDAGACQEGGAVDAGAATIIAASCTVAVVQVVDLQEECSGAGGTHVPFDVIQVGKGPSVTKLDHGGHAYYAPADGPKQLGQYFVAGVDPYGKLVPRPDIPGWCIGGLAPTDGHAHTLLLASDEADAKAKMQALLAP